MPNSVPRTMRAMVLHHSGEALRLEHWPIPQPAAGQLQLRVEACGVCRTDLHLLDGELPYPRWPIIPGHEIVGRVSAIGAGVTGFTVGERVGVPWLGWTCGQCRFCLSGRENLCESARFTGYQIHGGYADYTVADARYCFPLPCHADQSPAELAPLLCAGLIGYRALRLAGEAHKVGIYGFGAAAHIIAQVMRHAGQAFYAFTRPGDAEAQDFARLLGASWVGGSDQTPPDLLDAALIFAADGRLVPQALRQLQTGGCVVCAGIHMSDIPGFSYADLWGERMIRSVANLTRQDGLDFLQLAPTIPVHTSTTAFALEQANEALACLRAGALRGAAVLVM
ncbi:MAG TPA: zinc-dependent alcohol dehydrogenase family protein [Chromobacteriaceae bacterium]|nr:zinc-dependent alcohol dehydrogenase family protein [Chromobacteriaceae bacterium]